MTAEDLATLKALLPVLLAALTLVGGVVVYNIQKAVDRKNSIHQERREVYRAFVVAYTDLIHRINVRATMDEQMAALNGLDRIHAELAVSAPDGVVNACADISMLVAKYAAEHTKEEDQRDPKVNDEAFLEMHEKYRDAVDEMRKDSFKSTETTKLILESLLKNALFSVGRF